MKKLRSSLIAALLAFSVVSFAGASCARAAMMGMVSTDLLGGINDTANNGGGMGYTLGLDLRFGVGVGADLGVGAQYLSRAFTGISNINYLQVPVILYFHLSPLLYFGVGGFYDFPITSGAGDNYGLTGALRLRPIGPLFVEGRFNYGLNTTNFSTNTSEFELLIGFNL